jgi:hypothetical protein
MRNLPESHIERKNILNNNLAVSEVYNTLGFNGILFEGIFYYTVQQAARFYEVDVRTIERLIDNHKQELSESGYDLFVGQKLKQFKETISQLTDIDVGQLAQEVDNETIGTRARSLTVFSFKALLNLGMLLQGSEKAREVRSLVLNIVIDVLNKKLGGTTKYINQREEEFLPAAIREYNYRQEFTNCLDQYIDDNRFKYSQLTDKIYVSIFKEKAKGYRQILRLGDKESVRATMYSEVLDLIASYENGFADYLKRRSIKLERKLKLSEANTLFKEFEEDTEKIYEPLREKARSLMASRDMAFRDALHEKLKGYISVVSSEDFERFLGSKSRTLEQRLKENMDVFKRLKDK